jgi:diadenylate cyclase
MLDAFITVRVLDVIDIILVALLMYQIYMLMRGTVAMNIFVAIFSFYLLWLIVKALNMQLLGTILGQFIGVGIIALIIVFQQEIRRFLLMIGTRYLSRKFSIENLFAWNLNTPLKVNIKAIVSSCQHMSKSKTGALIVIAKRSTLHLYAETGEIINANTSSSLIESIFFKNSPLHDGAIIIIDDKIYAARCVLPVSENPNLLKQHGMRHRAALGMSENTDSLIVVVSEETGHIAIAENGQIIEVDTKELGQKLDEEFSNATYNRQLT